MKKIIIFLFSSYLVFGYISVSANRYNVHSVPYDQGGMTSCDDDGNGAVGNCAQISGSPSVGTAGSCLSGPLTVTSPGNIPCLYWDEEAPTISIDLGSYINNTWTNSIVTATPICNDAGGSWCKAGSYEYKVSSSIFACNSGGPGWINSSSHNIVGAINANTIQYICYRGTDNAGNLGYSSMYTIRIDRLPPDTTDINGTIPFANSNILADSSRNFQVNVDPNGGSPITSVKVFFENYSTINTFKAAIDECAISCPQNIQNVDLNRTANGSRMYTLRVSEICDQVGNCVGDILPATTLKDLNYFVYANSLLLSGSVIVNDLIAPSNIADGSDKNLTIKLEDQYGNIVIPATGISRTIDYYFNTDNTVYLDQYTRTGNGVYLKPTNSSSYDNTLIPTLVNLNLLASQISSDGEYKFKFKIYTPTRESDIKSNSSLHFIGINTTINDASLGIINSGFNISNSAFSLRSNPLYYTTISGGIKDDGFALGGVQDGTIQIQKNGSEITSNNDLYFEFGSGNTNQVNSKLNLRVGTLVTNAINPVGEGNPNYSIYKPNFLLGNFDFYTKLLLATGAIINDMQNSYFSTHIGYDITDPNGLGILSPVYNSDIYGKDSYWGTIGTGNVYGAALKIIGQTYSTKYNEIISGQSGNEVKLVKGIITKSGLKTEIRKNAYDIIRSAIENNSGNTINDSNIINNVDGAKLLSGSLLYFGDLNGDKVTLNSSTFTLTFNGNKTILIEGGNLYINGNINVSGDKSLLSIVVLKDINGKGGNVYINPNVRLIKAVIYADKSLISYDGTNELDGNTALSVLKNQLYIYGSVFSENTVGGSSADPIKCPYYVNSCPDQETAQKYDLNYLRRYYLKDTDNDEIGDTPGLGGISYFSSGSINYKYPLVIQYNPLIQTNPPLIFRK